MSVTRLVRSAVRTLIAACVVAAMAVHAAEGIDDADFDYLPPDSMMESLMFALGNMFRSPSHAGSYTTAKKRLYKQIEDEFTLYCGCTTDLDERTFDEASCGYVPRNDNERAHRLEAEHVVPAFWIANFHEESCWEADDSCGSARECRLENDTRFKKAHNDLVNLFPSIGELNRNLPSTLRQCHSRFTEQGLLWSVNRVG